MVPLLPKLRMAIDEKDTSVLLHTNITDYTELMREDISNKDINITFCDCCGEAEHSDSNDIYWVDNTELLDINDERAKLDMLCDEIGSICRHCFESRDVIEINDMAIKLYNTLTE
jgi:hypothetical protein